MIEPSNSTPINRASRRSTWVFGCYCFVALFVGCLVIGLIVPTLHHWSGAEQSRESPLFLRAFYIIVGVMLVSWVVLPCLPWRRNSEPKTDGLVSDAGTLPFQFSVRSLLIITSLVALAIVGLTNARLDLVVLLVATLLIFLMWMVVHRLSWMWQLAALVACMYFPYAWIFLDDGFSNAGLKEIIASFGLPSFVPSIFLCRMIGQRVENVPWVLVGLTAIELGIGVWLIRLGPKRTISWMIFVLFVSLLGSFFLDAAIRI